MATSVYYYGGKYPKVLIAVMSRRLKKRGQAAIVNTPTEVSAEMVVLDDDTIAFRLFRLDATGDWRIGTAADLFETIRNHPMMVEEERHARHG